MSFEPTDFLPYLLNQAAEAASLDFQRAYKARYGMLRNEWRVLFHLGRYGEMSARDIVARAMIHKTKVSRAVAALERRRFLSRETAAEDRRRELLALTPAGRKVFRDLTALAERHDAMLLAGVAERDAAVVRRVLRQLAGL